MKKYYTTLTEEQELIMNMVHEFTETTVKEYAAEIDQTNRFPEEVFEKAAELGLFTLLIPEEFGGAGQPIKMRWMVQEEVARESPGISFILGGNIGSPMMWKMFPDWAEEMFPKACEGKAGIAYAVADPAGAWNWTEQPVFARREGDHWVLNGTRLFVTGAGRAEAVVAHGKCDDGKIRYFGVRKGQPGFETKKIEHKIGLSGINTGVLNFENVIVEDKNVPPMPSSPEGHIKGGTGMPSLIALSAVAIGGAMGVWEKTMEYVKVRTTHGKPLASLSVINARMAKLAKDIEIARCYEHTLWDQYVNGTIEKEAPYMLKVHAADLFVNVARECIETWGGIGVFEDTGIARYLRDAVTCLPADCPADGHFAQIAWHLGLPVEYTMDH